MEEKSVLFDRICRRLSGGGKGKAFLMAVFILALLLCSCPQVLAAEEVPPATGPDWAIDSATAPAVVAESAILMDVSTGVTLYEKNIHTREYPASITKILTCLLAKENSELTDIVTFSHEAIYGIERGSNIGIDEGEQLSMKDCLYAAMLESANEVSAGMGEYVGGSKEDFARMMNDKVRELGGTDSNFVNANGLPDDNHYTSAYDMALVGRAFFQDELLSEISGTVIHHISATATQKDDIDLRNHHKMLPGCQMGNLHPYEYTVGGKTGYTVAAGNTLVTCAEKDGHRLVCVVLKDKTPNHYLDSIALFDYGFACYETPEIHTKINERVQELRAQEEPEEESQEETGEDQTAQQEEDGGNVTEGQDKNLQDENLQDKNLRGESREPDSADREEGSGEQETEKEVGKEGKSGFFTVLKISVAVVVLVAVSICGYFLYRAFRRERERKKRQAEIMARHRAWKERDKE